LTFPFTVVRCWGDERGGGGVKRADRNCGSSGSTVTCARTPEIGTSTSRRSAMHVSGAGGSGTASDAPPRERGPRADFVARVLQLVRSPDAHPSVSSEVGYSIRRAAAADARGSRRH
jgi:hypothetical protein